jgi:hypothetical protein
MNLKTSQLLVSKRSKPLVAYFLWMEFNQSSNSNEYRIEFDSDGSIQEYSIQEMEEYMELFQPGMVVYCWTGKSSFCHKHQAGYYQITNDLNMHRYSDTIASRYLGKNVPGKTQEDFARALKLKAFW